jgi:uncharacterized protein YkwD
VTDQFSIRRPRRVIARVLGLSGGALLMAFLLVWAPQPASGFDSSAAESTLWQLLNADRTNNGVAPLKQNSTLVSIARWRSKDMVQRDYFGHTVLGTSYKVSHWYDINGIGWRNWGENIAYNYGYSDAQSPIQINTGLMGSTGHRANILNSDFTQGAVGAYGADGVSFLGQVMNVRMYTELFLKPRSGTTTTPSKPKPTATLRTDVSADPSPTALLDGAQLLKGPAAHPIESMNGALARAEAYEPAHVSSAPVVAGAYRVQAVHTPARGVLQVLFGSLVGFLFG